MADVTISGIATSATVPTNADLYECEQGATTKKITHNNLHLLAAGTTALAPLRFTAGVNLTTPIVGAQEFDGTVFYATPVASARSVVPSEQFLCTTGDFTLAAASGVQTAFPTTCDVITLAASTSYFIEGCYDITCGATTHTTAMAFLLAGGASVTAINYTAWGFNAVANTTVTASNSTWVNQVASTVVTVTAITAGNHIVFSGVIRMNAGGTVTPQIAFSANPTGTNLMKAGSWIRFYPIGTNTVEKVGNIG